LNITLSIQAVSLLIELKEKYFNYRGKIMIMIDMNLNQICKFKLKRYCNSEGSITDVTNHECPSVQEEKINQTCSGA